MTGLALVRRPADASRLPPDTQVVVLDPAWTPPSTLRPESSLPARPVRQVVRAVTDEVDVVEVSLALLDRWAEDAGLPDAFNLDGVAWWFQARMLLRWDVHELVLWSLVLERLAAEAPAAVVTVPASRPRLVDAARARARASGGPLPNVITGVGGPLRPIARRGLRLGASLLRTAARWRPATRSRAVAMERRLADLARERGGVLALAWPQAYQVLEGPSGVMRTDPYLEPALEHVAAAGRRVLTIGLAMDHTRDDDWALLHANATLLPERFLAERAGLRAVAATIGIVAPGPAPDEMPGAGPAAAIARAAAVPGRAGDVDLGPALAHLVAPYAGRWLNRQRHTLVTAGTTLDQLRPDAVITDREASRTAWLAAARRRGIRTIAVQHGMIYANSPEYFPSAARRVRPQFTCVFGEDERDLLVDGAGYPAASVVVTGSPRPLEDRPSGDPEERAAVRRELGVRDLDRMLLVSVAHNELLGQLHTFGALERVLGGPLPGIHLVIKLHPQDHAPPRHEAFLQHLAAAGGYAAPRMSVVRDVDLYRYLRAADAHLGQYSTVLSDAVVAGSPNMIIVGAARSDTLGYVEAGVATPVRTIHEVRSFMASPVAMDPGARSRFLARHFRSGDAAPRIADVLLAGASATSSAA